jgi:hypothetical protein
MVIGRFHVRGERRGFTWDPDRQVRPPRGQNSDVDIFAPPLIRHGLACPGYPNRHSARQVARRSPDRSGDGHLDVWAPPLIRHGLACPGYPNRHSARQAVQRSPDRSGEGHVDIWAPPLIRHGSACPGHPNQHGAGSGSPECPRPGRRRAMTGGGASSEPASGRRACFGPWTRRIVVSATSDQGTAGNPWILPPEESSDATCIPSLWPVRRMAPLSVVIGSLHLTTLLSGGPVNAPETKAGCAIPGSWLMLAPMRVDFRPAQRRRGMESPDLCVPQEDP